MSTVTGGKHPIGHTLDPHLRHANRIACEDLHNLRRDVVGSGGKAYGTDSARTHIFRGKLQQTEHQLPVDPGEGTAEKCDLTRYIRRNGGKCRLNFVPDRCAVKTNSARDRVLIAEYTPIRAAKVWYEKRDIRVFFHGR